MDSDVGWPISSVRKYATWVRVAVSMCIRRQLQVVMVIIIFGFGESSSDSDSSSFWGLTTIYYFKQFPRYIQRRWNVAGWRDAGSVRLRYRVFRNPDAPSFSTILTRPNPPTYGSTDTTGFGSNVYSGFGLRCKTSLCFKDNFALGLLHNQYGYNLNHGSNSPCNLLLHHAIPWSQSASTFQLYVPHWILLQV